MLLAHSAATKAQPLMQEECQSTPVSLRFRLPLPPSVNNQYATVGKRRVLNAEARAFKRDVGKIIERARLDGVIGEPAVQELEGSFLGVYLTFFFETPKRRDLDGGLKIALDAICNALGLDDRMVVDLHLTKRIDPLHPRLEVELEAISSWSFDREYVLLDDSPMSGNGERE